MRFYMKGLWDLICRYKTVFLMSGKFVTHLMLLSEKKMSMHFFLLTLNSLKHQYPDVLILLYGVFYYL